MKGVVLGKENIRIYKIIRLVRFPVGHFELTTVKAVTQVLFD